MALEATDDGGQVRVEESVNRAEVEGDADVAKGKVSSLQTRGGGGSGTPEPDGTTVSGRGTVPAWHERAGGGEERPPDGPPKVLERPLLRQGEFSGVRPSRDSWRTRGSVFASSGPFTVRG